MEKIQIVLAPLASFWLAMEGFMKATTFMNGMRETIISGVIGDHKLTIFHRETIFVDWCLSMIGFIISNTMLSIVIFLLSELVDGAQFAILAVALTTFLGAILFMICGISDYRAISRTLRHAKRDSKHEEFLDNKPN
jgi:hypothetical protein